MTLKRLRKTGLKEYTLDTSGLKSYYFDYNTLTGQTICRKVARGDKNALNIMQKNQLYEIVPSMQLKNNLTQ